MKLTENYKVGIVTSVVASALFLYLLNPILNLVGKVMFGLGAGIYSVYIDRLFLQAAAGTVAHPSFILLEIVSALAVGFSLGSIVFELLASIHREAPLPHSSRAQGPAKRSRLVAASCFVYFF